MPMMKSSRRGLNLRQWKEQSIARPSLLHAPAGDLWLPLRRRGEEPFALTAEVGSRVERDQPVAVCRESSRAPIFAPAAGEIVSTETIPHPFFEEEVLCAVLRPEDTFPTDQTQPLNTDAIRPDEILSCCREAGLVDELDGMPLDRKLQRAARQGCSLLVADALDDQPYCTSRLRTLIEQADAVGAGTVLAATAVGAARSCIAAYRPSSVASHLPLEAGGVTVLELSGHYPCLPELKEQMSLWGGGIRIGAAAAAALFRAVTLCAKQHESMVTVGGPCVQTAVNFRVRTGTLAGELLERVSLRRAPGLLVVNGAMTGFAAELGRPLPILPGITSLLLYPEHKADASGRCVGCGRCVDVCPVGLVPALIARAVDRGGASAARRLMAQRCIGCGCCSFVCPAGCDVSRTVSEAAEVLRMPEENASKGRNDAVRDVSVRPIEKD